MVPNALSECCYVLKVERSLIMIHNICVELFTSPTKVHNYEKNTSFPQESLVVLRRSWEEFDRATEREVNSGF